MFFKSCFWKEIKRNHSNIKVKSKTAINQNRPLMERISKSRFQIIAPFSMRSFSRPSLCSITRLETIGEKELLHLRRFPRYKVSTIGRHVKEQRAVLRSRPGSPGSCLAHKESSKSPFLPAFLPLSSCSCTSSRPSSLPSLFPRPSLSPSPSYLFSRTSLSRSPLAC